MSRVDRWRNAITQLKFQNANQNPCSSNLSEEPAQQATRKIIHDSTSESPIGKCRGLTELVAPGESDSVCNCQDKGNS